MKPTCYVACPSYASSGPLESAKFIEKARVLCEKLDWTLIASPLLDLHMPGGVWLPRDEREEDLRRAVRHDVVVGFRGGYGAIQLAPLLLKIKASRKPRLIGFSDVTILHAAWRKRGWGDGCYGTLPERWDGRQGRSLLALLRRERLVFDSRSERATRVVRAGTATGPCFAACVSVLAGLCGTGLIPDLRGRILAIEDIDEKPYQVDFALNQLFFSGALRGIAGLLGGSFSHESREDYQGPSHGEVLGAWAERLKVPCLEQLSFGHMDDPFVMPCGQCVTLRALRADTWSISIDPRSVG
jgi:muramoyltetrapeptide carboxypeptidase